MFPSCRPPFAAKRKITFYNYLIVFSFIFYMDLHFQLKLCIIRNEHTLPLVFDRSVQAMGVKPNILVVGSFVMDVIATTERVPRSGQTVYGRSFHTAPGGKGANQALQCARLGANVTMMGLSLIHICSRSMPPLHRLCILTDLKITPPFAAPWRAAAPSKPMTAC